MFPITLEFNNGKVATCFPPCYGFLRGAEWDDWDQRWHHDSFAMKYHRRSRFYGNERETFTEAEPFGPIRQLLTVTNEAGENDVPGSIFMLEDLRVIWNSGARIMGECYIDAESVSPKAWRWPNDSMKNGYDKSRVYEKRTKSPLDIFNEENNTDLTVMKVMSDLEAAIDVGRESCLRWDEERGIFGVSTLDVPCDRVLFYLMVHRELDGFWDSKKMQTFLHLHYNVGKPIMVAFLVSRLVAYGNNNVPYFAGETGDSCILPATYFWVGCGKRFKEPTTVEWRQHAYTSGQGHERDDDMGFFEMNPVIEGYEDQTYEDFNDSLFGAIFGGVLQDRLLLDEAGGKPVANLVSEFYRTVAKYDVYSRRGGNKYCLYWTSERALQGASSQELTVGFGRWVDHVISLLMEE